MKETRRNVQPRNAFVTFSGGSLSTFQPGTLQVERLLASNQLVAPKLTDMSTWTGRTGKDGLRSFTDEGGNFRLEQNATKTSKWAKLASSGHDVAWEFGANRRYRGRMLVDGEILTPPEATKKFLTGQPKSSSK